MKKESNNPSKCPTCGRPTQKINGVRLHIFTKCTTKIRKCKVVKTPDAIFKYNKI